ncbi:hypothetical protein E2P81_ATG09352 [Venturia nashicola]|nr:hypothetical protein E2P81_ATG09352 [Venturia nashicola]
MGVHANIDSPSLNRNLIQVKVAYRRFGGRLDDDVHLHHHQLFFLEMTGQDLRAYLDCCSNDAWSDKGIDSDLIMCTDTVEYPVLDLVPSSKSAPQKTRQDEN